MITNITIILSSDSTLTTGAVCDAIAAEFTEADVEVNKGSTDIDSIRVNDDAFESTLAAEDHINAILNQLWMESQES